MKKAKTAAKLDPLAERPDLAFSRAVPGKYTNLLAEGTNVAIIDPAMHAHFPDSESVNRALRAFLAIGESMNAASPRHRRRPATAQAIVGKSKSIERSATG